MTTRIKATPKASRNGTATTNGRPPAPPTVSDELRNAILRDRQDPRTNAFPNASREMFDSVMAQIEWHAEQVTQQAHSITRGKPEDVLDWLAETARDGRAIWALASLLYDAAETVR